MDGPTVSEVWARPTPALRPFVTAYTGFELRGLPAGEHLGVPGHRLTAVVTFGQPLAVSAPAKVRGAGGQYASISSGLLTSAVTIRHDGHQQGVKLSLTPLGARAVYGVPAAALANTLVPVEVLLGGADAELQQRLAGTSTWAERFRVLDDLLTRLVSRTLRRRSDALDVRPEVAETWRRLIHAQGMVQVGVLARELGWSRRHLTERFRAEYGLTPKTVARILRFEHAQRLAATGGAQSWAEVSAQAGYADQSHLVRDWRAFTGHPPSVWRDGDALVSELEHV